MTEFFMDKFSKSTGIIYYCSFVVYLQINIRAHSANFNLLLNNLTICHEKFNTAGFFYSDMVKF